MVLRKQAWAIVQRPPTGESRSKCFSLRFFRVSARPWGAHREAAKRWPKAGPCPYVCLCLSPRRPSAWAQPRLGRAPLQPYSQVRQRWAKSPGSKSMACPRMGLGRCGQRQTVLDGVGIHAVQLDPRCGGHRCQRFALGEGRALFITSVQAAPRHGSHRGPHRPARRPAIRPPHRPARAARWRRR